MIRLQLEFLEIMIGNPCNLSCKGCTTFSDLVHKNFVPWATGQAWLTPWLNRLDIQAIGIMGGEPLMNPDLKAWLRGIRSLLPNAQIRFVTNGVLLDQNWWVVDLLDELGNAVLKISQHIESDTLNNTINKIMVSREWEPTVDFGISRWRSSSGLLFQVSKPTRFLKTFRNEYNDMLPHNNSPEEAFKVCVQKKCPMLYNGRIWKCGTLALTPGVLQRFGNPNLAQWQDYIDPGLEPDCNNVQLMHFVNNFGRPHSLCRQCPSEKDVNSMFDHISTVSLRKIRSED